MEKKEKLYNVVCNDIIAKIRRREISVGDKLPKTKELAKEYGVSVVTVEHALKKLKEMNIVYSIKKAGTFVNGKKSDSFQKVVAFVLPNTLKDSVRIYESACVTALFNNCFIECMDSKGDPKRERTHFKTVLNGDYYGVAIFSPFGLENIDVVSKIAIAGIPIVFMDCSIDGIDAPLITSNGAQGIELIIDYLVAKGHQKIAFYEYKKNHFMNTEKDRFKGYFNGLIKNGIPINGDYLYKPKRNQTFLEWFESLEDRPTAIVCSNDVRARGVISSLEKGGYKVPDDVSVTGFDCSENDRQFGNYTSVKQNFREIGHLAIKTLLSEVRPKSSEIIYSSVKLFEGATVKSLL